MPRKVKPGVNDLGTVNPDLAGMITECQEKTCTAKGQPKWCEEHGCDESGCESKGDRNNKDFPPKEGKYCHRHGNGNCIAVVNGTNCKNVGQNENPVGHKRPGRNHLCHSHKHGTCKGRPGETCENYASASDHKLCKNCNTPDCEKCGHRETTKRGGSYICDPCAGLICPTCRGPVNTEYGRGQCDRCANGTCLGKECKSPANRNNGYCETHNGNPDHVKGDNSNKHIFYRFLIVEKNTDNVEVYQVFGITDNTNRFNTYKSSFKKATNGAKIIRDIQYLELPSGEAAKTESNFKKRHNFTNISPPKRKVPASQSGVQGTMNESFLIDNMRKDPKMVKDDFEKEWDKLMQKGTLKII